MELQNALNRFRPGCEQEENSGVAWFPVETIARHVSEPWMQEHIYQKLIGKTTRK